MYQKHIWQDGSLIAQDISMLRLKLSYCGACSCTHLDFNCYAVNRLPFLKASCQASPKHQPYSTGVVSHPFAAFFTQFTRAKAAACWLSQRGEEVYVHRFRINKVIEGRWHPIK